MQNHSKLGKKRSSIWLHFSAVSCSKAKCGICGCIFSYKNGGTSNLKKHLIAKHPIVTDSVVTPEKVIIDQSQVSTNTIKITQGQDADKECKKECRILRPVYRIRRLAQPGSETLTFLEPYLKPKRSTSSNISDSCGGNDAEQSVLEYNVKPSSEVQEEEIQWELSNFSEDKKKPASPSPCCASSVDSSHLSQKSPDQRLQPQKHKETSSLHLFLSSLKDDIEKLPEPDQRQLKLDIFQLVHNKLIEHNL